MFANSTTKFQTYTVQFGIVTTFNNLCIQFILTKYGYLLDARYAKISGFSPALVYLTVVCHKSLCACFMLLLQHIIYHYLDM